VTLTMLPAKPGDRKQDFELRRISRNEYETLKRFFD
jgi:hypothetical protein